MTAAEIGRAFLVEVLYLIFNEDYYTATAGEGLLRPELSTEALRLGRLLTALAPGESEVHGPVALMGSRPPAPPREPARPVNRSRSTSRDLGRWDHLLIHRGFAALLRARDLGGPPGPYVLQAAIAACHAQARTAQDTDWARIGGAGRVGRGGSRHGPEFREEIARCLKAAPPILVLDLAGISFFGSAGLSALVEAQDRAVPDTVVRVVANQRAVRRPIEMTALDKVLSVFLSVDEAVS